MKTLLVLSGIFLVIYACGTAKTAKVDSSKNAETQVSQLPDSVITWISIEKAQLLNATNPKAIFVDVYTDWCGWCKKMDNTTFMDKEVAAYLNKSFYCVKFDAESDATIKFNSEEYVNVDPANTKSTHQFATALLGQRQGYPSYAIIGSNLKIEGKIVGYKVKQELITELDAYKTKLGLK